MIITHDFRCMIIGDPISDRIAVYCNDLMWRERRTTSATFLGSTSTKLPKNTCPGDGSRHMVSHSRKVSTKGSNFPKTVFLGYHVCAQPTGHGKCSATPTLFPSPSGHPTDLSFLGDFCWGMYRFPAIHFRTSSFATVSATAIRGCQQFFQTYLPGGATIGSPICSGIQSTARFLVDCLHQLKSMSKVLSCVLLNVHVVYSAASSRQCHVSQYTFSLMVQKTD